MGKPLVLRAELASVFSFVGKRPLPVRRALAGGGGVLTELASGRGLQ